MIMHEINENFPILDFQYLKKKISAVSTQPKKFKEWQKDDFSQIFQKILFWNVKSLFFLHIKIAKNKTQLLINARRLIWKNLNLDGNIRTKMPQKCRQRKAKKIRFRKSAKLYKQVNKINWKNMCTYRKFNNTNNNREKMTRKLEI